MVRRRPLFRCVLSLTLALALETDRATAQVIPPPLPGTPTATVAAGSRYKAGTIRRFFLGSNYRDLWSTPITVPVLDLRTVLEPLVQTRGIGAAFELHLDPERPAGVGHMNRAGNRAVAEAIAKTLM